MKNAQITQLLKEAGDGEDEVYSELMPHVYNQLRDIAYSHLVKEAQEHTYSKTDLVHEAFIKLFEYEKTDYKDRNHFYAIASRCMRQFLVDHARKKLAEKRGGDSVEVTFIDQLMQEKNEASNLIEIDEALKKLEIVDEQLARIVEYRYIGEMSVDCTADLLGVSSSTVTRNWKKARGWLFRELKKPVE